MATMKALVYAATGKPTLEDRPKPTILKPTDAIVKMIKTTICGTDLHIFKGDVATCDTGRIIGHEGVAVVEQVGDKVSHFKPGDKVIVSCITSCTNCTNCRTGMPSHCTDGGWTLGNTIDGTQAEYTRVPHADGSLHRVAKSASDDAQLMLSDIVPAGYECGVLQGKVKLGSTVAIVGSGPVGLSALITSQLFSPLQVIMIDLNENRLSTARSLGATHTVVSGPNAVEQVMELTAGRGVDTVIEAVGIPATFELCQKLVAVGGTIANLGVHGAKVDLHMEKLWDRNITITTRLVSTTSTSMLIKLVESGKIQPEKVLTHNFAFGDIEKAYSIFGAAESHNCLKVVINI
ncbi:L-iditol 2-dehydrogenase [Lentinula detonsa]|uniref:L-iditol 2-dehydrogenase n=1 Tax=Lentinula detonsa TaxID=2804962 RepID=A0A9W8TZA5_9AGAR|nr:L-iditol 2-dehydrogenase [Lentinula detonsa]KAJ3989231.1 L-iditol 2-dehydrogenase [Lentinula detonsa]